MLARCSSARSGAKRSVASRKLYTENDPTNPTKNSLLGERLVHQQIGNQKLCVQFRDAYGKCNMLKCDREMQTA